MASHYLPISAANGAPAFAEAGTIRSISAFAPARRIVWGEPIGALYLTFGPHSQGETGKIVG
jgi:hypothetical protein